MTDDAFRFGIRRRLLSPAPVCLIWVGLVAAVDLIAAPAPFGVAGLERAQALAVNRILFETLNRTEWVLAGVALVLAAWTRPPRRVWAPLVTALGALAVQSLWLLPALAARTELIQAGGTPPASPVHALYGVSEVLKLLALLATGLLGLPRMSRTDG